MVIYDLHMTISVTVFKARCLALLRQMERRGEPLEITRRGRVVARLTPAVAVVEPWARLRGTGRLLADPGEAMFADSDFAALR